MNAMFTIITSGYTQNRGYFHGMLKVREGLIEQGHSEGFKHRVWYCTWKTDMHRVAAELSILCNRQGLKPFVMTVGYSYGAWATLQLAKELGELGIDVEVCILSDPVGRSWFMPKQLPSAMSMLGRNWAPKLKVQNTKMLHSFYQTNNRPQGHQLIAVDGSKISKPVKLDYKHQQMDDAKEFHEKVYGCASAVRRCMQTAA